MRTFTCRATSVESVRICATAVARRRTTQATKRPVIDHSESLPRINSCDCCPSLCAKRAATMHVRRGIRQSDSACEHHQSDFFAGGFFPETLHPDDSCDVVCAGSFCRFLALDSQTTAASNQPQMTSTVKAHVRLLGPVALRPAEHEAAIVHSNRRGF